MWLYRSNCWKILGLMDAQWQPSPPPHHHSHHWLPLCQTTLELSLNCVLFSGYFFIFLSPSSGKKLPTLFPVRENDSACGESAGPGNHNRDIRRTTQRLLGVRFHYCNHRSAMMWSCIIALPEAGLWGDIRPGNWVWTELGSVMGKKIKEILTVAAAAAAGTRWGLNGFRRHWRWSLCEMQCIWCEDTQISHVEGYTQGPGSINLQVINICTGHLVTLKPEYHKNWSGTD